MKNNRIRALALAMSLWLLAGCALSNTKAEPTPSSVPSPTAVPTAAPTPTASPTPSPSPAPEGVSFPDGVHADVDFADLAWELYDLTDFTAAAERLGQTGDEAEARELYDWLLEEYDRLHTLDELAWIDFYTYGTEADAQACQTTDELLTRAGDILQTAVADALNGLPGDGFSGYVGEFVSDSLTDYEASSQRELWIRNRETELTLAYNQLLEEELSEPERNERAAELLIELVSIRNELASLYGYSSYADYAYENIYGRDFTAADAAELCIRMKEYARRYYQNCCYCSVFYEDMGEAARKTPEELMDMLRTYAPRVSPQAAEAQQYMERHGFYRLTQSGADVGYTTLLPAYNAPFLFNRLYGNIGDIQDTFHEFGHYYDAYWNVPENCLSSPGSYDIYEIHSTGMEALSCGWYGEIFGDRAEMARLWQMDSILYSAISGCLFDEFQQCLYADPPKSAGEINSLYTRLLRQYGGALWNRGDEYLWMYVAHNFENPFYYISYAASALAATQLWALAETDRDAALDKYNRLVMLGAFDMGYCELLRTVGLRVFTDGLSPCLETFYSEFEDMCLRYDRG